MRRGNFRAKITPLPPQTHTEPPLPALERKVLERFGTLESKVEVGGRSSLLAQKSLRQEMAVILREIDSRISNVVDRINRLDAAAYTVAGHVQAIHGEIKPPIDHRPELTALKAAIPQPVDHTSDLAALRTALSAAVKELRASFKTINAGISNIKTGEDGDQTLAGAMSSVLDKLDYISSCMAKDVTPASVDTSGIEATLKRERVLTFDNDGNVVGWKYK